MWHALGQALFVHSTDTSACSVPVLMASCLSYPLIGTSEGGLEGVAILFQFALGFPVPMSPEPHHSRMTGTSGHPGLACVAETRGSRRLFPVSHEVPRRSLLVLRPQRLAASVPFRAQSCLRCCDLSLRPPTSGATISPVCRVSSCR